MKTNRTIYLDVFRGGASICIIMYHLTTRYDQMIGHVSQWPFNLPWGWMAWSVFFVLTGFLVHPKQERIKDFIFGKVIRLFPGYWAAMILCFITTRLFLQEYAVSINDFLVDLTMLGNYLGRESVVGVDWTLSINLIYYAFIVVIMLLSRVKPHPKLFLSLAVIWSLIACAISVAQNHGMENRILKIAGIVLAGNYAHMFLTGIVLKDISLHKDARVKDTMLILLALTEHWLIFRSVGFMVFYVLFVLAFLICTILDRETMCRLFNAKWAVILRPLVFVAGISYPLYLIHEYLGFAIIKGYEMTIGTSELIIVVCIIVSILLAWCINRFIEKPIVHFLKNRGAKNANS